MNNQQSAHAHAHTHAHTQVKLVCPRTGLTISFGPAESSDTVAAYLATYSCHPLFLGQQVRRLEQAIRYSLKHPQPEHQQPAELVAGSTIYQLTKPGKQVLLFSKQEQEYTADLLALAEATAELSKASRSSVLGLWKAATELPLGKCATLRIQEAAQSPKGLAIRIVDHIKELTKTLKAAELASLELEHEKQAEKEALQALQAAETAERKLQSMSTQSCRENWALWVSYPLSFVSTDTAKNLPLPAAKLKRLAEDYPYQDFAGATLSLLELAQQSLKAVAEPWLAASRGTEDQRLRVRKCLSVLDAAVDAQLSADPDEC